MPWKSVLGKTTLALLMAAAFTQIASAQISEPIKVSGGLVQGMPGKNAAIAVFEGIPFAAPPVGDLRWRAPNP